jgi:cysteinyl-tRNA synthetase
VFPGIVEAERRVDYLHATTERLAALAQQAGAGAAPAVASARAPFAKLAAEAEGRARAALDDDLNTPVVLSVLADLAKAANEVADLAQKRRKDAALVASAPHVASALHLAIRSIADRLGLFQASAAEYAARTRDQRLRVRGLAAEAIEAKIVERAEARANKEWARGDAVRDELAALGVELLDTADGTTWRIGA